MKLGRVICSKLWAPLVLVLGLVTPCKAQPAARLGPRRESAVADEPGLGAVAVRDREGRRRARVGADPGADAGSGRAAVGGQQREVDQAGGGRHRGRAATPAAGRDHRSGAAGRRRSRPTSRRWRTAGSTSRAPRGSRSPRWSPTSCCCAGPSSPRARPADGGGGHDAGRSRPHGLREGGDEPLDVHPPARRRGPRRAPVRLPPRPLRAPG